MVQLENPTTWKDLALAEMIEIEGKHEGIMNIRLYFIYWGVGLLGKRMSLQPGDPAIGVPGSTLLLTRQVRIHVIGSFFNYYIFGFDPL